MIHITFWENHDNQIKRFLVEGHAGHGEYGRDIVCAAVSALTIATLNGLSEHAKLSLNIEMKEGYVYCILPENMSDIQAIQGEAILRTTFLAFENMVSEYKEYVNLNKKAL